MVENTSDFYMDPRIMDPELSPNEKALRDKFVTEYIKDMNSVLACIRIGFMRTFAEEYAKKFMSESYVQSEIYRRRYEEETVSTKAQAEKDKLLVLSVLREAMLHGPYASRVAAAGRMAQMQGYDAAAKTEVLHRGGVMMVPGMANLDEWEKAATTSQDKLVQEARS